MTNSRRVVFVDRVLPDYRIPFFDGLYSLLKGKSIDLIVAFGQDERGALPSQAAIDSPWGRFKESRYLPLGFFWMPIAHFLEGADVVVAGEGTRNLRNFVLMATRRRRNFRLGLWGHGFDMQAKPGSVGNWLKHRYINNCDWWFCYTEGVRTRIVANGFDQERTTVVRNAIDTESLRIERDTMTDMELEQASHEMALGCGPVCVYCGSFYREKRIRFLIDTCIMVRKAIPEFEMVIIGSGPDQHLVELAADNFGWIHFVGKCDGRRKATYFCLSSLFLLPGAVGLGVIDSFAFGVPIATTTYPFHGPEVEYLKHESNGLIFPNDIILYVGGIVEVLKDQPRLQALQSGCRRSSDKFTLSHMVDSFAEGISRCLELDGKS